MKDSQKLKELDGALLEMLEIKSTLDTALSRYGARPLGTFTEGSAVFSSQLAFYEYLLTHQWRKVRVTRTPAYDVMGAAALFFSADPGRLTTPTVRNISGGWRLKSSPKKPPLE